MGAVITNPSFIAPLSVVLGGTGAASFTAGRVLLGNGASAIATDANLVWANGGLGISAGASPAAQLAISGTYSANSRLMLLNSTLNSTATSQQTGLQVGFSVNPAGASLSNLFGMLFLPTITGSSVVITSVYGIFARLDTTAGYTGNITNFFANAIFDPILGGSGTLTNLYGLYVSPLTKGANNYGVFLGLADAANRWNVYATGTAPNYFGGRVGIRTNTPTATLDIRAASTSEPSVVVRAIGGQTADITQWQDSTGAVITSINKDGALSFTDGSGTGKLYLSGGDLWYLGASGTPTLIARA